MSRIPTSDIAKDLSALSPAQRSLFQVLLKEEGLHISSPILPRSRTTNRFPLSFGQQRMWFLDQLEPGGFAYNMYVPVRLTGKLVLPALHEALSEVVRRHEILRTVFVMDDDQPVQSITGHQPPVLGVLDINELAADERDGETRQLAVAEARRPFNLSRGPLLRVTVVRSDRESNVVLVTLHHIITDAWSMGIFNREVAALYEAFLNGCPSPLPDLMIQYADFAAWQRDWLAADEGKSHLGYWEHVLANLPALNLRIARPRPAAQSSRGRTHSFAAPARLTNSLKNIARAESATLFMTLLASFQILLHHYSGQHDIVVGTDVANRSREENEPLIGFFVNQLVLRTNLSGDPSFLELLRRARETTLGAYAHQDFPFNKLVEHLNPARDAGRHPLCQIKLILQSAPAGMAFEMAGLTVDHLNLGHEAAHSDLTLYLADENNALAGTAEYNTDLFTEDTIKAMMEDFLALLGAVVTSPDSPLHVIVEGLSQSSRKRKLNRNKQQLASDFRDFLKVRPTPRDLSEKALVDIGFLGTGAELPLVLRPTTPDVDTIALVSSMRKDIETFLLKYGAILFRDFRLESVTEFREFARALSSELLDYKGGSTPRSLVQDGIYTSTEYPAHQQIPLHNEASYSLDWPTKIWFCCFEPAQEGGETPIADSRVVFQRLDPSIRDRFIKRKVMYVRNYGNGLDLSWQQAFMTAQKSQVEDYCRKSAIEFEWRDGHGLTTRRVGQAAIEHPITGEMVWFNQAHLFHISNLDPSIAKSLLSIFKPEELPRNAYYGDGAPIELSALDAIREAYRGASVSFCWQRGDVLMLDNMLASHGRRPFGGPRTILVAMGDAYH